MRILCGLANSALKSTLPLRNRNLKKTGCHGIGFDGIDQRINGLGIGKRLTRTLVEGHPECGMRMRNCRLPSENGFDFEWINFDLVNWLLSLN